MPDGSATSHLYLPKLVTVISEGYSARLFRQDAVAGLTVAIVALPLSMAIAVASGVSPDRGLYTSIVGGIVVSALGGSRFQIGGPAGAFIVLVSATVAQHGIEGLLLAVFLSGLALTVIGALRLGSLIRHIPHPVTIGFTAGIAATILASQMKDLGGLRLDGKEPGAFFPKIATLTSALPTVTPAAVALGVGTAAIIFVLRSVKPSWPGMLIAATLASAAAILLHLPVETIASRFGGIPQGLPTPNLPSFALPSILEMLPSVFSFTLLGGIESLLSAKVADGMTRRKHRSNMELVAQGVANVLSPIFGGISVTGTIARTATNIRAGARTPFAGIMHSLFLLIFMVAAAPLAGFIPLAALAGILVVVAWNMAEKAEFIRLLRNWPDATVLLATFGLTLIEDLTVGIVAGCVVAAIFAITGRRIATE
jgi:SulP family sulfate permease